MQKRNITLLLLVAVIAVGLAAGCGGGPTQSKSTTGGSAAPGTWAQGTFTTVGSLATGRVGHTATWIPQVEQVLVVGGKGRSGGTDCVLDSAELFDPKTGNFTPTQGRLSGAKTIGQNGRMAHSAIALPNGRVLIAGGQTDVAGLNVLNSIEIYNAFATTAQFGPPSTATNLTEAKAEAILFLYPTSLGTSEVAIAGGRGASHNALRSVNFYSPDSNQIVTGRTANLNFARYGAKALPLGSNVGDKWVVAGGYSSASTAAGYEIVDPANAAYFSVSSGNNSQNRAAFDAALLGTQVALFGGLTPSPSSTLDTIEFFDVASSTWNVVTQRLVTPRSGHTVTVLNNGDVLVIGGQSAAGQVLGTAEVVSGSGLGATVSQVAQQLRVPRKNHTATHIVTTINGASAEMVLIAGGEDAAGQPIATAEVFTVAGVQVPIITPAGGNGLAPVLTSLTPNQGPVGTAVTVKGTNFSTTPTQNIVKFNGIVAPVLSAVSSSGQVELRVNVPQGAVTGDVTVTVGGLTSATGTQSVFTISTSTTGTGGTSQFSGPPRIIILLPMSGPMFMPVGIGGSNFADPSVPYFAGVPSISLFNYAIQNIPLIGSISVGFTIVPPAAPQGNADVVIEYFGQRSNPYPFTIQ